MANFMKHNADEIDLVRCWIAIRSQIPIGRAVKRGNDVRTVGVNVIFPPIDWPILPGKPHQGSAPPDSE